MDMVFNLLLEQFCNENIYIISCMINNNYLLDLQKHLLVLIIVFLACEDDLDQIVIFFLCTLL